MSYDYGREKLSAAVSGLATGTARLKDRLTDATASQLHRINPDEDLPEVIRSDFRALLDQLTLTTIDRSVEAMEDAEVLAAIEKIVGFYGAVCAASVEG